MRGNLLGTVLVGIFILLTLGIGLTLASIHHLRFTAIAANLIAARFHAESGLNHAIGEVLRRPEFNAPLDTAHWSVRTTNNVKGTQSVPGQGREVPPGCVHMVSTARQGGVTSTVEAMLYLPPFPYAVAASGIFRTKGRVVVAPAPGSFEPAGLLANHPGPASVMLGPGSRVTVDVVSAGDIAVGEDVEVMGETLPRQSPVSMPQLNLRQYEPMGDTVQVLAPRLVGNANLEGPYRSAGPVTIPGDLHLDSAIVYVKGNLHVTGAITGRGAVLVEGATRIDKASSLEADAQVAILSEGNVLLNGDDAATSRFRGVVYTKGDFQASRVNLVGVFYIGWQSGCSSGVAGDAPRLRPRDGAYRHQQTDCLRLSLW